MKLNQRKLISIMVLAIILALLFSSVAMAAGVPRYIYYRNAANELVRADYQLAEDNLFPPVSDSRLMDAIRNKLREAFLAQPQRAIYVEDFDGRTIDYRKAARDGLTYAEAYFNFEYWAASQTAIKELVIDPVTGNPVEVPIITPVTSATFTTVATHNTVTITLTGGTFKAGTITANDFIFTGSNAAALADGTFTRTSNTVVTITGLTLTAATNNAVTVKAATQATQATSVNAVATAAITPVTSAAFSTTADSNTVTITLSGGTFKAGTITANDFIFTGANAAALADGTFTRTSNTVVTITGLTLTAATNNAVTVKAATQATQAASVTAVANVATGVTISTSKTTAGVSFSSGSFTSGLVTPAPASVVYNNFEDVIDVADGIKVTLKWVTNAALNGIMTVNGAAKTATASVYVYQANSAQNTASIFANAIRNIKNDSNYTGLLKATVTSVTGRVNISDIEESVSAPASIVNAWKFEITTSTTPFDIVQDNRTITQQVAASVPGAKLHVDAVKAVYKITVTSGAAASGDLIVNVKDTINDLDVDVLVAVVNGNSINEVANRIKLALAANATVSANYDVDVSGAEVTLTQKEGKAESIAVTLK